MNNVNNKTSLPLGPSDRVRKIFLTASEEHQNLIRKILTEEREVQYMSRRSDIHNTIYNLVRKVVK